MSLSSTNASNVFIDLATFSELEGFLYGGPEAITWFVAAVQKSNWFSYIPISLRHTGTIDFGQRNVSASVNRSGDYVLAVWFRCRIPQIGFASAVGGIDGGEIRWTNNLMHNIFEKVHITFNELTVQEFDSFWLDMNYQFRLPGAKRVGYQNMIGAVSSMTDPVGPDLPLGTGGYFSVPLPFWFGEDSGIALPVAALPFNDIKINYRFRRWEELVMIINTAGATNPTVGDIFQYSGGVLSSSKPAMDDPQTFAHYAVIHNDERVKMGDAPRDILIHQVQNAQAAPFKDVSSATSFDIRMSHSIVLLCFAALNTSLYDATSGSGGGEWSNYTTLSEATVAGGLGDDPIAFTTLIYENTTRLAQGSDYFSLVHPYLLMDAIPEETGYHTWSYSLKPWDPLRPAGSTNYSKLANVSITHNMSPAAQNAANSLMPDGVTAIERTNTAGANVAFPQTFRHVLVARNHNIVRVANGSLGHPTL